MPERSDPILFLAYANDRVNPENYLRDLVEEIRIIRQTLEAKVVPPYRVVIRPNATLDDILEVFDQYEGQVRIFHYTGHADSLNLMLENSSGEIEKAGLRGFTRLLASQHGLKFVFLNGCTTKNFVRELAAAGIPAVLGTETVINDRAAVLFAERFYQRLADEKSVTAAFHDAEIKVQTLMVSNEGFRLVNFEGMIEDRVPWFLEGKQLNWRLSLTTRQSGGSIIHLLCDRFRQVEVFRDKLENILVDSDPLPHFFVIHGLRTEKHKSLVRRFKEMDIRYNSERLFGKEMGTVHSYEVKDWPQTGDLAMRQRNLKRSISRAVDIPNLLGGQWQAVDLVRQQKLQRGMVVFQHNLNSERWGRYYHETDQVVCRRFLAHST